MHRVAAVAAGGLDCLPHGGAVITLLQICNLTHRESYLDIFVTAVVVPVIALIILIVLGSPSVLFDSPPPATGHRPGRP